MKKSILALAFMLSTCGVQPAMASMDDGYNSPECVFTMEADEPEVRDFALKTLLPAADKNQAMLIEDLSFKDTLVAVQIVVCEGKSPKFALEFIGL